MYIIGNAYTIFSFNGVRRKASVVVPSSCFHQTVFYSCSPTATGLYLANFMSVHISIITSHKDIVCIKDDFQSILHSLSTPILINIISSHPMKCELMLFVMNHLLYLNFKAFQILFPTALD